MFSHTLNTQTPPPCVPFRATLDEILLEHDCAFGSTRPQRRGKLRDRRRGKDQRARGCVTKQAVEYTEIYPKTQIPRANIRVDITLQAEGDERDKIINPIVAKQRVNNETERIHLCKYTFV